MTMTDASSRDLPFETALYESVLARDSDNVEALIALGEACTRQGAYARGLEVDQKLARLRPSDPVVRYNLACSLALLQRPDEAFEALSQAVDLGYRDLGHLDSDADLASLREDPRFGALRDRILKAVPSRSV